MKCEKCGSELIQGEEFCKACENPLEISQTSPKAKKKRGCLVALLSIIAVVVVAFIGAAIFLPGFFSPKDFGIKTSKAAYESAVNKLNYTKDMAPSTGKAEDYTYVYGELSKIQTSLNSEELTSFFNYNRPEYYALKKVQIRINPDNSMEFSCALNTDYVLSEVLDGEYSEQELTKAFPWIKTVPNSVNVYAHLSGEIADNKAVSFSLKDVEVMGIDLPSSLYDTQETQTEICSLLDNFLTKSTEKTNSTYTSVEVNNGELQINGFFPSSLKREGIN